jgi:iron(III) transport system permease protein
MTDTKITDGGRGGPAAATLVQRARRLLTPRTLIVGVVVLLVGYLAAVPLLFMLIGTFSGPEGFTLSAFGRAYGGNRQAGTMMLNSVVFAVGSAGLALLLGTVLAYVHVRTDAPLKGLFFAASMVPLIVPGVLYATTWIFLADPEIGLLNTLFFEPLFGSGLLDVYSLPGMIWVEGTHLAPLAFLLMVGSFQALDPSLEESAAMSGARTLTVLRRVTLPLVRPGLVAAALLMFVRSLESFEVPTLLGLRNGTYVFTSRIYYELRSYPIDYGAAGAYALSLLVIAAVGVWFSNWLNRNSRNYQTISGKAFRPRPIPLGRARPWVGGLTIAYFVVAIVLPVLVLVYASLLKYYRGPSMEALRTMSFDNYRAAFDSPIALTALWNSLLLAVGTATVVVFVTAIASWVVVRTKARGRRLIDVLAFTPLVIPGLVLGLALLFVYLRTPLPIYGTLLILLISFSTKNLPYGMQYAGAAMRQISVDLEESAAVSGASWWMTFRRIVLPLASGGIVAGWIYIVIVSFRELSSAILLYTPGNEVISILVWQQFENGSFTVLAAIGVVMIAILTVLVLIAQRLGAKVGI